MFIAPEVIGSFGALEQTVGRFFFYGLMAAALIAPKWKNLVSALGRKEWLGIAGLAITGNILNYILIVNAVQMGSIAMTSLIVGLIPVAVTIIGSRESGAVSLRRLLPSILLCCASAITIGWNALDAISAAQDLTPFIGMLCAIGSLLSWATYAVKNRQWLSQLHHISAYDWNLLIGVATGAFSLLLLPIAFLFADQPHSPDQWAMFMAVSIGIAIFSSIIGNALWNQSTRLLPMTMIGQMILFETLFALLYAFAWESRSPTLNEALAFAFVVGSVFTCISAHRTPAAAAAPALTPQA